MAEIYYGLCAAIDQPNRCRQDDHMLKKKLQTHNWAYRINTSILGIIVLDAWLLSARECGWRAKLSQREFFEDLTTVAQRIPSWTLIGYAYIFGGSPAGTVKGLPKPVG